MALKAQRALAAGITPIVCVGETLAEREAGETEAVVRRQLAAVIHVNGHCISEVVVAYEPVWAIGTGKTATPEQAQQVHAVLRAQLAAASDKAARIRLLYGGSMNAGNAQRLLAQPDIDGGLVERLAQARRLPANYRCSPIRISARRYQIRSYRRMNLLVNVILAAQILTALGMIGLILIQHGKGADMGAAFGGGSSGSLFGASEVLTSCRALPLCWLRCFCLHYGAGLFW